MASYFRLTLDTHAPVVDFGLPPYCAPEETVQIIVQADEPLANWQNIQMVNCHGEVTPLTFLYEDGKFYGEITFHERDGLVTFTYQFRDDVLNTTEVMTKTLNVFPTMVLTMDTAESVRDIDTIEIIRTTTTDIDIRDMLISAQERDISTSAQDRLIQTEVTQWHTN